MKNMKPAYRLSVLFILAMLFLSPASCFIASAKSADSSHRNARASARKYNASVQHPAKAGNLELTDYSVLGQELSFLYTLYGDSFTFAENRTSPASPRRLIMPEPENNTALLGCHLQQLTAEYDGNWSVCVRCLQTGKTILINDVPMKSASVMKLFIMGAVYQDIADHHLERTPEMVDHLCNMITYSSNEDANELLRILGNGSIRTGIDRVNRFIRLQGLSSRTREYNGFMYDDAIINPEHFNQVTALDCALFLEKIYHRNFISRAVCNEIESFMLAQDIRYKIPGRLPYDVLIANKTGEMEAVENDVAIIFSDACDYIICVFSSDWNDSDIAMEHIQELSAEVYRFYNDSTWAGETWSRAMKYQDFAAFALSGSKDASPD